MGIQGVRAFSFIVSLILSSAILLPSAFASESQRRCLTLLLGKSAYTAQLDIKTANARHEKLGDKEPQVNVSYGSEMPILHSFEKEGLPYSDIAVWFPSLRETPGFESTLTPKQKLEERFKKEKSMPAQKQVFTRWLMDVKSLIGVTQEEQKVWRVKSAEERLKYLLSLKDPFTVLAVKHREVLFEQEILDFNDIQPGPLAPKGVVVGDDLGSYEVRMAEAVADRITYLELRDATEKYLEGRIGHKHSFHAWPTDAAARAKIAPQYIELLDATTWYLFWRQMKRNPEDGSILTHPYLGVYTRSSLNRLHKAMVEDNAKAFKNKFRMVGARAFPANPDAPEQKGRKYIVDWESRSGNKGDKRDFVTDMIEARFTSGDYSGLRDFRAVDFDPSAPIEKIMAPFLTPSQIKVMERFQESHPAMTYSSNPASHNHVRNRILSPLLRWQDRIPMDLKTEELEKQQKIYAESILTVARKFLRKLDSGKHSSPTALGELREEAVSELEEAMYKFSAKVRLDENFERYLRIVPSVVPEITVNSTGPVDVNKVPIGIEYSHRFPIKPRSRSGAEDVIKAFAEALSEQFGSNAPIELANGDSHGHGTIVKMKVTDKNGERWRVEWDGISRYYVAGKVRRAWGGHAETPTPRFTPQSIDDGIRDLFAAARSLGMVPWRSAGGGHFNVDVEELQKNFLPQVGARKMANFIAYTESNLEMMMFLWMHPLRLHAAHPVTLQPGFAEAITNFKGDWIDLGVTLYEYRYFNTYVGRKPKYTPWNYTALMTPILPKAYKSGSLDIRSPAQVWFPHFGDVTGRIEGRLFDSPTDEYMAALQIKYMRAVMNKAFNAKKPLALKKKYSRADIETWRNNPQKWVADAEAHLIELGLNPTEFKWLIWESHSNRMRYEERPQQYEIFDGFLPAQPPAESFDGAA